VKFAKKRLDDAKLGGVRPVPAPGIRPVPVDPAPNVRFAADEKAVAELQAKLAKLAAEVAKVVADTKKSEADLKAAEAELAALKKAVPLDRIKATEAIERAAAAATQIAKLSQKRLELEVEIEKLKTKTAEVGK